MKDRSLLQRLQTFQSPALSLVEGFKRFNLLSFARLRVETVS
jgi:hypothetical protein